MKAATLAVFLLASAASGARAQPAKPPANVMLLMWQFKNDTGQPVDGICIEKREFNAFSSWLEAEGAALEPPIVSGGSSPKEACYTFKKEIAPKATIVVKIAPTDRRKEKASIGYSWTSKGRQIGGLLHATFFAYGTLKYGP